MPQAQMEGLTLDRLDEPHFLEIARLVEEHAGIRLPPSKRTMVEGRLRKRVRALGFSDLNAYGDAVFRKGLLAREFPYVVDCVTTNKTDFFREPQQFDLLRNRLIGEMRATAGRRSSPLRFWSAASSIGAEAYTIAMVVADTLADPGAVSVFGTDISPTVLETARTAVYPLAMAEPIPNPYRSRYLMLARDPRREEFRIVPELRRRVQFDPMNLMEERYPQEKDFDAVFCRNVLIYFAKDVQTAVIDRLVRHLRIGGYLLLGHSETMSTGRPERLRQIAPSVFQKVGRT
jgi:chemotaxis protein methyltransferase CheR/two-component system chemotaxis response regulator CheB